LLFFAQFGYQNNYPPLNVENFLIITNVISLVLATYYRPYHYNQFFEFILNVINIFQRVKQFDAYSIFVPFYLCSKYWGRM
jgi:hypothetical protein